MSESKKTVFVVGLGPGGGQFLTVQAQSALQQAEVLCGYTVYIDLVRPLYPEKECYTTGMTREIDRCRWALDTARAGRDVALVCSGDAGVYGMASPLLELAEEYPDVNVEVVPGLTAALSGGAVLGAPLAQTASRRGRSSKSGWPAPLRAISHWRCTIPRPRAARTICAGPWTSCWRTAKPRTPSAALCGTLAGKGRKSTSCPSASSGIPRWICSPPSLWATPPPAR